MAVIDKKHLFSLPVETVSGTQLGKIVDIEIDVDTHVVRCYCIRRHGLSNPLAGRTNTLQIHPRQVQALTAEKMVVDDASIPVGSSVATEAPSASA
ncbi:MAG: PRC-barrel domain-containing protein [Patescibacteria group bacterium]|jgi:sporulation protein YlmC with PRC-barrel domain